MFKERVSSRETGVFNATQSVNVIQIQYVSECENKNITGVSRKSV